MGRRGTFYPYFVCAKYSTFCSKELASPNGEASVVWEDYEMTRHELEKADNLCHGNWIEIQRLYAYIDKLKSILKENNIDYPEF